MFDLVTEVFKQMTSTVSLDRYLNKGLANENI